MGKGIFGGGGTYSITYNLPYYFYKLSKNLSMGKISEKAKTRLSAIELYYKLRNVSLVCFLFNLSRKTFYKWQKRFEAGKLCEIAYARCYSSKSSLSSFDFILRFSLLVNGKISAILSDNGSEFAKYFDEACKKLKITHIFTRIKTPKDNSVNERFNRTLKEEFLAVDEYFEPLLTQSDLSEANNLLTSFLIFYNLKRPYCSLNYQTSIEWYNNHWANKEKGVLPMYPTYTHFLTFLIIIFLEE